MAEATIDELLQVQLQLQQLQRRRQQLNRDANHDGGNGDEQGGEGDDLLLLTSWLLSKDQDARSHTLSH